MIHFAPVAGEVRPLPGLRRTGRIVGLTAQGLMRRFTADGRVHSTPPELMAGQTRKETEGVFLLRDGRAVFEPIDVGIAGDRYFEVLKGLKSGDEVITGNDLYGGSYRMFTKVFANYGIKFHFVDLADLSNIEKNISANTRLIWLETPTNPTMQIIDIEAAARDIEQSVGLLRRRL